jgi:uncharacterized NAD(P)/FAD-binding protein YdhS
MLRCDVAIIGGGFSGTMVAAHLARAESALRVRLFEPNVLGCGAAFGTPFSEHVCNTRAGAMSAYSDDPEHFVRWLGSRFAPNDFVPRQLYGRYLGEIARRVFDRSDFAIVPDRAASVDSQRTGTFVLTTQSGTRFEADHVVLAIGNPPPNDHLLPRGLRLHPGYIGDPWIFDYRKVGGHVFLIGSGLTALDVLVALDASGHRGAVTVLSRHARFPEAHAENVKPYDVVPALDASSARSLLRSFRRQLESAAARGYDWRAVVDAVRPECEALWRRLPDSERRRFDRHLRALWERHRHRVPQTVAARVSYYAAAGKLRIYAGRISACAGGEITIATSQGEVRARPDWIVNCSGIGRGQWERDSLLASLLRSGTLEVEPLGWGLRSTADNLWLTGALLRGTRFESTAVVELRLIAESVATQLAATLRTAATLAG